MFIHEISAGIIEFLQQIIIDGGYGIVVVISFMESLPLLGTLVPGQTLVVLSGFLAKLGYLSPIVAILCACLGAIVGDMVSYSIGRKYGLTFLSKYGKYFLITAKDVEKAQVVVDRHTALSLLIGRFNPLTRPLIPFAIGASRVRLKRFVPLDVIGCIIWSTVAVMVGYVFGASYEFVSELIGKVVVVAVVIIVLLIWGYRYINVRRHIFNRSEFRLFTMLLVAIYVFARTMQDIVSSKAFLAQFDVWLSLFVERLQHSFDLFYRCISMIGSPLVLSLIGLGYVFHFARKGKYLESATLFVAGSVSLFLTSALKDMIGRIRPDNAVIQLADQSFPSGHAVSVTVFFFFVIYFFARHIQHHVYRELCIAGAVLCVVAVCFSRVYLNVHWFTDVVAGVALGLIVSTLTVLCMRYIVASHVRRLFEIK